MDDASTNSPPKIRILVIEDHEIVRDGVRMMVNSQPDMQVIGEASDGRTALQLAAELAPDIVVMSRLRLKNTRSPAEWSIAEADLERKIANQEQLTLLDVRERASYAVNH